MDMYTLKAFFGWMTLINLGFYIWTALMCVCCKGVLTSVSGKMFGVSEATGKAIIYGYVGTYKLLFIVFNLVPWLALVIMT
jgi:hypothetical protein